MAIISNSMWSDPEVHKNRSDGVRKSYTKELKQHRSSTTKSHWDAGEKEIGFLPKQQTDMSILRDRLYERAGYKCEDCGVTEEKNLEKTGRRLELHHLNYDRYLPELEDVQLLCKQCHLGFHKRHKTKDHRFPKVAKAVNNLLVALGVNMKDENYIETPARVAAFLETHFISSNDFEENIEGFKQSVFPAEYNDLIIQCPIDAYGMCPHHLLPVLYKVAIGYIPRNNTIGLSKITRIVNLCMKPPMLQETATTFLANTLKDILETPDIVVVVGGKHMCMTVRGVKNDSITLTSAVRGAFMDEPATRAEFYSLSHAREIILSW